MTATVSALTKWKHISIVAALGAASGAVAQLLSLGVIDSTLASALGIIIGDALIYEHSA